MTVRHDRIVSDPEIMFGKPVIKGTRIPVETILRMLGDGVRADEIIASYPHLSGEDILAVQRFAADFMAEEEIVYG